MNGGSERRSGLLYRKMFWSIVGSGMTLLISLIVWGYSDLSARKVDKDVLIEITRRLEERIDLKLESIRREIRAALRGGIE